MELDLEDGEDPRIKAMVIFDYLADLNYDYYNPECVSPLKAKVKRSDLVHCLNSTTDQIRDNSVDEDTLVRAILTGHWDLEILMFFSCFNLVYIPEYLKAKEEQGEKSCIDLASDLEWLYFTRNVTAVKEEVRSFMAAALSEFCEECEEKPDSRLLKVFSEYYYEWLQKWRSADNLPFVKDIIQGKNKSLILILRKVAMLSFCDGGETSREAMGTPNFVPSYREKMTEFFQQVIDCDPENIWQLASSTLMECGEDSKINWKNLAVLVVSMVEKTHYPLIKTAIRKLIDYSLDHKSSWHLYAAFLLGRMCCSNISGLNMTYLQWFSSTFSCESHRPLNTDEKAHFFFKCLAEVLYSDPPCFVKVHVHKVASVPSSCQAYLSEYLQLAKASLLSKNESTELGIFENPYGVSTTENDVRWIVHLFNETGKIPPNFLASLAFRRQYFERELLPILLSWCEGLSSPYHTLIKKLAILGKISNVTYTNHVEECRQKIKCHKKKDRF